MQQPTIYQKIKEAVDAIKERRQLKPEVGLILGSGLGAIAEELENPTIIPYTDIPHFHGTSIEGHAGRMILGHFHGTPAVFLQGRFHAYEGYSMEEVVFPTRVVCALGIQTLILTNAAGAVNTRFRPAELMLIEDHLNLMGDNPLKGPNLTQLGPRFPDLSEAYNRGCLEIMQNAANELGIPVHIGVYAGLLGPTYETRAEIRMFRTLGADAVGMSTVPEAIAANHLGVRVAGVSCITNLAAGSTPSKLTHQEVIENSRAATDKLQRLLATSIPRLVGQIMSIPSKLPKKLHDLFLAAEKAQKNAYAPYSKFKVGAAIRLANGKIFASGNLENVVNGASVCAERGAIQAIMSEYGKVEMVELVVVTEGSPPAFCCGVCRQVLSEFVPKGKDLEITTVNHQGEVASSTLRALLPHAFTPEYVES